MRDSLTARELPERLARWRAVLTTGLPRALVGFAVTLLFGALFVWRTDINGLAASLGGITLALLIPAVFLNFADVWFQAFRLRALIAHLSPPGPNQLAAALLVGIMGNNVLPMRMGMVLRAQYLSSRYGLRLASMLSTLVVEGFMDGLVLAALFVPVLLIVGAEGSVAWAVFLSGLIAAGGLIVLRIAHSPVWSARIAPLGRAFRALSLPPALTHQVASWAGQFADGVASVRSGRSLALAAASTAGAWLTTAGVYYTVGLAFSLDVDWTAYVVLTAAINISGLLQASGGNIGPYEFVAQEVIAGFGIDRAEAGAYAIVTHLVRLVPPTLVGLALFGWHTLVSPAPNESRS